MLLKESYDRLKKQAKKDLGSNVVLHLLRDLYNQSAHYLEGVERKEIPSKVDNKKYFMFSLDAKNSRAVNSNLYLDDVNEVEGFFSAIEQNNYAGLASDVLTKLAYSVVITFISSIDLIKKGDIKTPGTYFEIFCGHMMARLLEVNPKTRIPILNLDRSATLPTDFIFDLGENRNKFHVPIKTSTRERVIQVWAHQRVLDGVYGLERFKGILICLSETKKDSRSHEVIEICLPTQWKVYQSFIARMHRVYYFDIPEKYSVLNSQEPRIPVLTFGDLFREVEELTAN